MKATKKIVGAACALVAAVALSAGSTFAWFSSNGEVSATGLKIDVNTSNAYLVISDSADFSAKKTSLDLAPQAGTDVEKLQPAAYETTATLDPTDDACITKEGNWYTAKGKDTVDGTLTGDKTVLTDETFSGHVVVSDIFVSVAEGSSEVEHVHMTVEATKADGSKGWDTTNGNSTISVVVLYQTIDKGGNIATWEKQELNAANNHAFTGGKLDLGALKADGADYIEIKVMVYFDGNNAQVTTANSGNLNGVTLGFKFVDGGTTTTTPEPSES